MAHSVLYKGGLDVMVNEVSAQVFDYTELDVPTADFLRIKETNMREIVGKAYTDLGRELKEAQDALAKNGYGCFRDWCESIGMKKDAVSRLIQRYDLIVANCDEREMLEYLPLSLSYEIAKPSAESTEAKAQAKVEVLDGTIATLKEYRERIAELEAQALQVESARRQADERAELAEQKAEQYKQLFGEQAMYDDYSLSS